MKKIILMLAFVLCIGGVAGAATLTDTTQFTATGTIAPEDFVSRGWGDVNKLDGFLDYVVWNISSPLIPLLLRLIRQR